MAALAPQAPCHRTQPAVRRGRGSRRRWRRGPGLGRPRQQHLDAFLRRQV